MRNIIERTFRITKRKFQILISIPEYSIQIQKDLVFVVAILYNFVHKLENNIGNQYFPSIDEKTTLDQSLEIEIYNLNKELEIMNKRRDQLV